MVSLDFVRFIAHILLFVIPAQVLLYTVGYSSEVVSVGILIVATVILWKLIL